MQPPEYSLARFFWWLEERASPKYKSLTSWRYPWFSPLLCARSSRCVIELTSDFKSAWCPLIVKIHEYLNTLCCNLITSCHIRNLMGQTHDFCPSKATLNTKFFEAAGGNIEHVCWEDSILCAEELSDERQNRVLGCSGKNPNIMDNWPWNDT